MSKKAAVIKASEFVKVWNSAKTFDDVVQEFGGKPLTYSVRARAFRKKGVPLQEFPSLRGGPRLDIESLKALAEKTRPGVKLAAPKEKKASKKSKK